MNVADMYDQVAERYNDLVLDTQYIGPVWVEKKLKSLEASHNKYLDLGCATGVIGEIISRINPDSNIIGIDISSEMVERAKNRNIYSKLHVHNLDDSIHHLVSDNIEVVTALGFTEFLESPERLLSEVFQMLDTGGTCFISFQLHDPKNSKLPRNTHSGSVVHTAYTEAEVKGMIERAGFKLKTLETMCGYVSGKGYECHYIMVEAVKN